MTTTTPPGYRAWFANGRQSIIFHPNRTLASVTVSVQRMAEWQNTRVIAIVLVRS